MMALSRTILVSSVEWFLCVLTSLSSSQAGQENADMVSLEVLTELPPLQDKEQSRGGTGWRGGRFGSGGGSFDRRGSGGSFSNRRGGGGGHGRSFSDRRGGGGFSNGGKQGGRGNRSERKW